MLSFCLAVLAQFVLAVDAHCVLAEPVTQVALADDAENLLNNTNTSNPNKPMLTTDSSCVKLNRSKSADTNPKHHPENDPIDNVTSTEPRSKSGMSERFVRIKLLKRLLTLAKLHTELIA